MKSTLLIKNVLALLLIGCMGTFTQAQTIWDSNMSEPITITPNESDPVVQEEVNLILVPATGTEFFTIINTFEPDDADAIQFAEGDITSLPASEVTVLEYQNFQSFVEMGGDGIAGSNYVALLLQNQAPIIARAGNLYFGLVLIGADLLNGTLTYTRTTTSSNPQYTFSVGGERKVGSTLVLAVSPTNPAFSFEWFDEANNILQTDDIYELTSSDLGKLLSVRVLEGDNVVEEILVGTIEDFIDRINLTKVVPQNASSVNLEWTANLDGLNGEFEIWRSKVDETPDNADNSGTILEQRVNATESTSYSFTDTGLEAGTTYYYSIRFKKS